MEHQFPERDWKALRALLPVALDRFCERVLAEVTAITSDTLRSNHERYLAVYKLIMERDRRLQDAFDDIRRSRAYLQLCYMCELGLVTEEEFARFSDGMRSVVETCVGRFPDRDG